MSATSRRLKADRTVGLKLCKSCKRMLPLSNFLWNGQRNGFKVTACSECVAKNMELYWRTNMVGRLPADFSEAADE
jgi:hypothetical protein